MEHLIDKEENEPYFCVDCKHCINVLTCKAFPKGIPQDILSNPESHTEVIDGQVGNFTFAPTHEPLKRNVYGFE